MGTHTTMPFVDNIVHFPSLQSISEHNVARRVKGGRRMEWVDRKAIMLSVECTLQGGSRKSNSAGKLRENQGFHAAERE